MAERAKRQKIKKEEQQGLGGEISFGNWGGKKWGGSGGG